MNKDVFIDIISSLIYRSLLLLDRNIDKDYFDIVPQTEMHSLNDEINYLADFIQEELAFANRFNKSK